MDEKGADCVIDPTANQTQNSYLKKTLQFVFTISIISFLVSYFSVLPLIFHQLHSYSAIFPFFAHALDRKYCMFLLCNGILAFLANNMKLNTSALNLNYGKRFDEENVHDDQLPQMLLFQQNAYIDHSPSDDAVSEEKLQQEQDDDNDDDDQDEDEERENVMVISLESEEWGEEEEEEEEDVDDEVEENAGVDDTSSVNDMRISTEELNKKFDEFIRKMKEEIRIEAQQRYMIVV